jgi:fatty acid desaturase
MPQTELELDNSRHMTALEKTRLLQLHQPRWSGTWTWLAFAAAFFGTQGLLLLALRGGMLWWMLPLLFVLSHLMHAHVLAFHEAAHETLCPKRWLNDAIGIFLGCLSFMSLSLYRAAHYSHHAFLATERDEELWPFVLPGTPRWSRRLAAFIELTMGLAFTPFLFLRTFLRAGTPVRNRNLRLRVWAELALIASVWTVVIAVVAWCDLWVTLLVLYAIPAVVAGNMQSLRKYTEHMGLAGTTPLGSTRSIVPSSLVGRLVAFSLLNEPFHGVHHQYPKLPQAVLPELPSALAPTRDGEQAPFPSYRHALWDMLKTLADPRIGAQWLADFPRGNRSCMLRADGPCVGRLGHVRSRQDRMLSN